MPRSNNLRMSELTDERVRGGAKHILLQGMLLVLAGLIWGVVVPAAPYPRLALAAHIQFESNGMLYILMAMLLLKLPHSVGPVSIRVMVLSAWLTWTLAVSEAVNAWWGTTRTLTVAASQAGARGGAAWQELVVSVTHIGAGIALIVAWVLLVLGFA